MGQHGLVAEKSINHGDEAHYHGEDHHVMSIPTYLIIFGILVVGTIVTWAVAQLDLDEFLFVGANTFVALAIAIFKTTCVVLYFMHVRYSGKLVWLSAFGAVIWLLILFSFTMQDYLTRGFAPGSGLR
jgi:cytochrome c oxidase subunit 4